MDLNKKLIDQLSDLSRNIKSLTSEVKENKPAVSAESTKKESTEKTNSVEEENKKFLKSLEEIFKKGVSEITKSNTESKGILKDAMGSINSKGIESALSAIAPLKNKGVQEIASNVKLPKEVSGLLGKLPKFADGGTMKKDGLAVVGEKGPEVVKLDKGDKVISNQKSKSRDEIEAELLAMELEERDREMDKFRRDTRINPDSSTMKTADQTLSPPAKIKLTENSTLEEVKAKLMQEDPDWYSNHPEDLEEEAQYEFENLKQKYETFTLEDIKKLGTPVSTPTPASPSAEEKKEPSKKEKRKEAKKLKKEEDLLKKSQKKEEKLKEKDLKEGEEKEEEGEEKKGPSLMDKGKSFLKEKGVLDKGKNILSGKTPMGDLLKDPSSLLGDKSQLLGKGIGAATSLLSNKGLREKGMEKLKGLKNKKEEEKTSSNISTESPELKKPKPESKSNEGIKKEEEKKEIQKNIEESKKEVKSPTPEKESPKEEPKKSKSVSSKKESEGLKSSDIDDIKSLLGKIASLLEGPLSIESMDSPFRPDSRRF